MRLITNWRPSLRMAWRDARRSRGRSILVLVMIALPVLAVTAADVVIQTANVSGTEALERRLGTADARVHFEAGVTSALQGFDPDDASSWSSSRKPQPPPGPDDIAAVLGRDVRAVEWREAYRLMTTDKGKLEVRTSVLDLSDPLAEGTFRLERGSLAGSADEVVINNDLAKRGFGIGDEIEVDKVGALTVVGVGEAADQRDTPTMVGLSPGLASESGTTWLVDAGPVTWDEVLELNKIGGLVLSRAVMENPPPESEIPAEIRSWSGTDDAWVAVAGLVVMMALIEVVLLAGPAFAVGARRQSRNLALIAASGGTPRQSRRVILASALVLGSLGAALGVVLGLGAAAVALPVVQRFDGSWFGPFDVPWLHLVGIAGFGLLSAFLAAVVPAWLASRQDVVAVLAGRRGDRPAGMRSPILGAVVLGIGVALSAYGATAQSGEFVIAFAALPTVLGMILLVPVAVAAVARLSRRFPLTMRYATRDAARHRTRTVPAVAAVAATVAGVVALGIANASDAKQSEATYTPSLPEGMASVSVYRASDDDWTQIQDVVAAELPSNEVTEMRGLRENRALASFRTDDGRVELEGWGSSYGSSVLVTDQADETVLPGLSEEERSRAQEALAAGGAVVWSSADQTADEVRVRVKESGRRNSEGQNAAATVPAYFVHPETWNAPGQAVLSTEAAQSRRRGAPAGRPGDRRRREQGTGERRQRGAEGDHRRRRPLRRARLRVGQRHGHPAAGARRPRGSADARGHPDRDLPRAVRCAARPRDPVRGRRFSPHPAWGGVVVRRRDRAGRCAAGGGGGIRARHRGDVPADRPELVPRGGRCVAEPLPRHPVAAGGCPGAGAAAAHGRHRVGVRPLAAAAGGPPRLTCSG